MTEKHSIYGGEATASMGTATTAEGRVRGQWSSRWVFILAATGSAVGLGNIWKFPYITGEHGGGAFVLVYLACILAIGIPLLMAEVLIGRRGGQNPAGSIGTLAEQAGASRHWRKLGWMTGLTGFLILSFYIVVAGWALAYIMPAGSGAFSGVDADTIGGQFGGLLGDPNRLILFSTLMLALTLAIVGFGVQKGLEQAVRYLMPGLFALLLVMLVYAMSTGYFWQGVEFLFAADFSKLTADSVLVALGHAFFTLSLASGAMMTYGSYLPKKASIAKTSLMVAIADTLVALLAGLVIFPIVFANGLEPGAGPGLIFVTLPIAFGQMPLGQLIGVMFFVMLAVAALTSAISLLEPAIAWMTEKFRMSRGKAVAVSGVLLWVLSLGTVFSFNEWSEFTLFGKTIFDSLDYLTANLMMPLGGLGIVLFTAWVLKESTVREELAIQHPLLFKTWWVCMRYLTPICILVVFLNVIGVI